MEILNLARYQNCIKTAMSTAKSQPKFIASRCDPARASSVGSVEYGQLITALQEIVMPPLAAASVTLQDHGFTIKQFQRSGALASLVVKKAGTSGWIYFHIHETFGPLMSNERLLWMYSLEGSVKGRQGKTGRLRNLDDIAPIREIVSGFVGLCLGTTTGEDAGGVPAKTTPDTIP